MLLIKSVSGTFHIPASLFNGPLGHLVGWGDILGAQHDVLGPHHRSLVLGIHVFKAKKAVLIDFCDKDSEILNRERSKGPLVDICNRKLRK